jgi:CRP/FNR family transcriptional regulator, cyclic AMP receptor protein
MSMKSHIAQNCSTCPSVSAQAFCCRCGDLLRRIEAVTCTSLYRGKTGLFAEGDAPRHVFILCTGKVKISTSSKLGKSIITRIAEPGDVLGLNAVVSNRAYGATAEMMTTGQVKRIPRHSLLRLMRDHEEVALAVAEQLSRSYFPVHEAMRSLGLTSHPVERLAKFLLSFSTNTSEHAFGSDAQVFEVPFTHQEIGDMIGASRETVSKLFSHLRRSRVVETRGPAGHHKSLRTRKNGAVLIAALCALSIPAPKRGMGAGTNYAAREIRLFVDPRSCFFGTLEIPQSRLQFRFFQSRKSICL